MSIFMFVTQCDNCVTLVTLKLFFILLVRNEQLGCFPLEISILINFLALLYFTTSICFKNSHIYDPYLFLLKRPSPYWLPTKAFLLIIHICFVLLYRRLIKKLMRQKIKIYPFSLHVTCVTTFLLSLSGGLLFQFL